MPRLRFRSVPRNLTSPPFSCRPRLLAGPATPPRPAAEARGADPRRDSPGLRVGPGTTGQPQVPLSASRHCEPRPEPCLRPRTGLQRCPLLPAGHQSLVAATGPGFGLDLPQPLPGRRRVAPRPLRLQALPGYGAQHRRKAPSNRPARSADVTIWPTFASGLTTRSFRPSFRYSSASIPPRPIATCSAWKTIVTP